MRGGRERPRAEPVCASQLPVVSVVRDAEAQLLPGVGAVVTCKVGAGGGTAPRVSLCVPVAGGSALSLQNSAWRAVARAAGTESSRAVNKSPGPVCTAQALTACCPSVQVCSINSRFAKVNILYVGSTPLKSTFRGTIR